MKICLRMNILTEIADCVCGGVKMYKCFAGTFGSSSFSTVSLFFRTIVYLSIVYAIGQVAMAVSAIHDITDTNHDGKPDNMTFHV